MKVLVVCSYRSYMESGVAAFVSDQVECLNQCGVETDYFLVKGKGIAGYIRNLFRLKKKLREYKPDLIHAHYGLCGLLANLQRRIPVVTTYHGSDINEPSNQKFSKLSICLSAWNIFVSKKMIDRIEVESNCSVIPCGVNVNLFSPMDKTECREKMRLDVNKKYALFSKGFGEKVKNYPLAKAVIEKLDGWKLIELVGYTHEQVALLMNACDVGLMTSFSEGSPQFIKEALACGMPIVSTDVGDVAEVIAGVNNARICSYDADDFAEKIKEVVAVGKLEGAFDDRFDNVSIAKKIVGIYNNVLK